MITITSKDNLDYKSRNSTGDLLKCGWGLGYRGINEDLTGLGMWQMLVGGKEGDGRI